MAHFAELDDNNIVLRVHVVNDSDCLDENGNESETVGKKFCADTWGGRWIQTSYNGKIRARYAGIGYTYDEEYDAFIPPKPFPSWILNTYSFDWMAPQPYPEIESELGGVSYSWSEELLQWVMDPVVSEDSDEII